MQILLSKVTEIKSLLEKAQELSEALKEHEMLTDEHHENYSNLMYGLENALEGAEYMQIDLEN